MSGHTTAIQSDAFSVALVGGISSTANAIIAAISGSPDPTPRIQAQQQNPISTTTILLIGGALVLGVFLLRR